LDNSVLEKELYELIKKSKDRVDLFFDALKPINLPKNINILIYFRALKYLNKPEFNNLMNELEKSIKS
jgi:hypothetical protein